MARILIVDDHPLLAQGLQQSVAPAHTVVATIHRGRDVLLAVARHRPDLVILDLNLGDMSGLEVLREVQAAEPAVLVVILTMHADTLFVETARRAGARGFLHKTLAAPALLDALARILRGEHVFPDLGAPPRATDGPHLTPRQREVLLLMAQGRTNQQIAEALGVGVKVIELHRTRLRRALGLRGSAELMSYAVRFAEGRLSARAPERPLPHAASEPP